jgi:hypothetical protein
VEGNELMIPEGLCQAYGFVHLGSRRFHCYNAAVCEIEIEGDKYPACAECRDEHEGLAKAA